MADLLCQCEGGVCITELQELSVGECRSDEPAQRAQKLDSVGRPDRHARESRLGSGGVFQGIAVAKKASEDGAGFGHRHERRLHERHQG